MMLSVQEIAGSINHFVATSQDVKTLANRCLESSGPQEFVNGKLGILLGVMKAYSVLYRNTHVDDRKSLEKQWSRLYRNVDVREAVDQLLDFEASWDRFLAEVDAQVAGQACDRVYAPRDLFPVGFPVIDARTHATREFSNCDLLLSDSFAHCLVVMLRHFA